jgi:serine/threonine protein kinase
MPDQENEKNGNDATHSLPDELIGGDKIRKDRIGQFRLESIIGSGGMGTIYRAYDEEMRRTIALKVLHKSLGISESVQVRFIREAWIAGQLEHPNIIDVYTRGEADEVSYIAMELADGGSLADYIKRTRKSISAGKDITSITGKRFIAHIIRKFIGLAEALEQVHSRGFIHRDIKPHNILLCGPDKSFKLTDFGIAHADDMTKITRAGDFIGTVKYMSPEQLTAYRAQVDKRTDIYSLGATLYEALALTLPFNGDSEQEYIAEVLAGHAVPVRKRNNHIPRDIETILMKATGHDPQSRYQTMTEFADDLRRALENRPILAKRESVIRRAHKHVKRNKLINLSTLFVLIAVVIVAVWYANSRSYHQRFERLIADYEVEGKLPSWDRGDPDQISLKREFLEKKLNAEHSKRVAKLLLEPQIRVSDYVSRTEQSTIQFFVESQNVYWGVATVIRPMVSFNDDTAKQIPLLDINIFQDGVSPNTNDSFPSPYLTIPALDSAVIRSLPLGQNTITLELRSWIFNTNDVEDIYGREGTPWRPIIGFDASDLYFGPTRERWSEYWAKLESSNIETWQGTIHTSADFWVVDSLPPNYPQMIRSGEFDNEMLESFTFGEFAINPSNEVLDSLGLLNALGFLSTDTTLIFFLYLFRNTSPIPINLASVLEIYLCDCNVPLLIDEIGMQRGNPQPGRGIQFRPFSEILRQYPEESEKLQACWGKIKAGNEIEWTVKIIPSRSVAASIPGVNSFWGGSLTFSSMTRAGELSKTYRPDTLQSTGD